MDATQIDKIFKEMKNKIIKEMFEKQTVTDDMVKQQIAKGWMSGRDKIVCLFCKSRFAFDVEDAKKNKSCPFCNNELYF